LRALRSLASDRPVTIGAMGGVLFGSIPFASIVAFAERYGIDDVNAFDDLAHVVRQLDSFEIGRLNQKANSSS
jgi:hypothetical protein